MLLSNAAMRALSRCAVATSISGCSTRDPRIMRSAPSRSSQAR